LKKLIIAFCIIAGIITLTKIAYEIPGVKKYIKQECHKALMQNAGIKYLLTPQGTKS